MKRIVSAVPGRIRIKDSQFCDSAVTDRVVKSIAGKLPVLATRVNPGASSIVIHYDFRKIPPAAMQQRTEQLLAAQLGGSAHPRRRRSTRLRINRYAKIGALASLAASLAFAFSGYKRLHIVTGWVFLACLSAHLTIFRRTLVH